MMLPQVATQWRIGGAIDFDGDGQADLIWNNTNTGQHAIWLMKNSVYSSSIGLPTFTTWLVEE
jgi:hypothetical protein